ncbi:unnamed protein product [Nesidiocoris tenuis]|uniref:BTB domain-containing protein n=1 Tax=Nesidiocoris tenuis TaxID=355587 RepID=A0A6H5GKN8_9HEMI|nr:unnamed protein product [Nesidiocoris tenuis]
MAGNQQFCLRWNNHQCTLISVFDNLLESGTLVDCTLAAEGQYLKAHKVVLSACSPFFEGLFSQHPENHPIIILKDVTFSELKAMLDYMYRGEVNISQDQLGTFLKAAESLQIKGLTDQSAAHGNGDLYRKAPPEPRRVIVPPISKSPIIGYPAGQGLPLVVEPRPPSSGPPSGQLPVHPASTPLKLTNNNVESPPRRKRRLSDDEPTAIEGAATQQTAPQVLAGALLPTTLPPVKLEQPPPQQPPSLDDYYKFKQEHKSDASVNNDDSGEEGGGGGPPYAADAEYDDEEEEMDLSSKPGTSTTPNSHPPGAYPRK